MLKDQEQLQGFLNKYISMVEKDWRTKQKTKHLNSQTPPVETNSKIFIWVARKNPEES